MAHESIVQVNADNFDSEVKQSSIPVVVDFYADWCGPCKMLAPVLDSLAEELGDSAKIAKLDIEEARELATEYQVATIPTLLFFSGGELKDRAGMMTKDAIAAKLKEI
ncbi:MAG: thioredoxin [Verrucomicrobiota bacterium]